MQLNKEQRKLVHKGQLLNTKDVELASIKKFGLKEYRKKLSELLNISQARVSHAFSGIAPYLLYRINQLVTVNITHEESVVNSQK